MNTLNKTHKEIFNEWVEGYTKECVYGDDAPDTPSYWDYRLHHEHIIESIVKFCKQVVTKATDTETQHVNEKVVSMMILGGPNTWFFGMTTQSLDFYLNSAYFNECPNDAVSYLSLPHKFVEELTVALNKAFGLNRGWIPIMGNSTLNILAIQRNLPIYSEIMLPFETRERPRHEVSDEWCKVHLIGEPKRSFEVMKEHHVIVVDNMINQIKTSIESWQNDNDIADFTTVLPYDHLGRMGNPQTPWIIAHDVTHGVFLVNKDYFETTSASKTNPEVKLCFPDELLDLIKDKAYEVLIKEDGKDKKYPHSFAIVESDFFTNGKRPTFVPLTKEKNEMTDLTNAIPDMTVVNIDTVPPVKKKPDFHRDVWEVMGINAKLVSSNLSRPFTEESDITIKTIIDEAVKAFVFHTKYRLSSQPDITKDVHQQTYQRHLIYRNETIWLLSAHVGTKTIMINTNIFSGDYPGISFGPEYFKYMLEKLKEELAVLKEMEFAADSVGFEFTDIILHRAM